MNRLSRSLLAAALTSACLHAAAAAADNPLSVHILDLQSGQPTAGVGSAPLQWPFDQHEGAA